MSLGGERCTTARLALMAARADAWLDRCARAVWLAVARSRAWSVTAVLVAASAAS